LPALDQTVASSPTSTTIQIGGGTAGANLLNLRDLGVSRTLTLLDGRRFVPATIAGAVDVNQLPATLVKRVDIVTGGASAAWGSDAVAGVVNFVLDKTFTGMKFEAQGGESFLGDAGNKKIDTTYGTGFDADRGHVLISALYSKDNGVPQVLDRDWYKGYQIIANPAHVSDPTQPQNILTPNVGLSTATFGGLILTGPNRGMQFGSGGSTSPFIFGTPPTGIVSGLLMVGGTPNLVEGRNGLTASLEQKNIFARVSYDFSDSVTGFVESSYARSTSNNLTSYYYASVNIHPDNAYVPSALAGSFTLGTLNGQFPQPQGHNTRETGRVVAGLDGKLGGDWVWHAYYQYGMTDALTAALNDPSKSRYAAAADAISVGDTVECRNLAANPGCVPLNVFGTDVASDAAIAYVLQTAYQHVTLHESVAAADFQGTLFSTWAGPVSLATGVEYRSEQMAEDADPFSLAGDLWVGNFKPSAGKYTVAEGYIEADIPLVKDLPFAKYIDVDLAGRFTDYSTSGEVETYKIGLSYQVTDDLRLRATESRDIRAPNLSELFLSGSSQSQAVLDPSQGNIPVLVHFVTTNNSDLSPEIAETHVVGAVYEPTWLPGLSASLDYYHIGVSGAITTLPIQAIVNNCHEGLTSFCSAVIRDSDGNITQVNNTPFNAQVLKNAGVDFELDYSSDLGDLVSTWPGSVSLRVLVTRLMEMQTELSGTTVNLLGETAEDALGGPPKWKGHASFAYMFGPSTTTLTARYIGPGVFNNSYTPQFIADNTISSRLYFDLSEIYDLTVAGVDTELYGVIDNLLGTDPPIAVRTSLSYAEPGTTATYYDVIGRRFRLGVRVRF
jgi:outer membrane receptor protein involved in Fe transport